jgi:hypothetical protein
MKANSVQSREEVKSPGDFFIDQAASEIVVFIPNDFGPGVIALENGRPRWTLTGDPAAPSLSPSILVPDIWHGNLTNGEFIGVEDVRAPAPEAPAPEAPAPEAPAPEAPAPEAPAKPAQTIPHRAPLFDE